MRIELKRVMGRATDREVNHINIIDGTLTYLAGGTEYGVDLDNIDSLVVTDSPDTDLSIEATRLRIKLDYKDDKIATLAAEVARLQAQVETMREALEIIATATPCLPGDDRIPVLAADVAGAVLASVGGE